MFHPYMKVVGERFPGTEISKEHKKILRRKKIAFNLLQDPKSMKSTQPSQKYSVTLPFFP